MLVFRFQHRWANTRRHWVTQHSHQRQTYIYIATIHMWIKVWLLSRLQSQLVVCGTPCFCSTFCTTLGNEKLTRKLLVDSESSCQLSDVKLAQTWIELLNIVNNVPNYPCVLSLHFLNILFIICIFAACLPLGETLQMLSAKQVKRKLRGMKMNKNRNLGI